MHHDDTIAAQVGNPSVFGHGMLTAGLMARVVKDWLGPEAIRKINVRFAKQVWPGETLTFTASVTGREPDGRRRWAGGARAVGDEPGRRGEAHRDGHRGRRPVRKRH